MIFWMTELIHQPNCIFGACREDERDPRLATFYTHLSTDVHHQSLGSNTVVLGDGDYPDFKGISKREIERSKPGLTVECEYVSPPYLLAGGTLSLQAAR